VSKVILSLITHKLSFLIVLTALIALSFPITPLANSSWHKSGQFTELCGQMGVKDSCGDQLIESQTNTIPISMHMEALMRGRQGCGSAIPRVGVRRELQVYRGCCFPSLFLRS
jgi:hypothetical protein